MKWSAYFEFYNSLARLTSYLATNMTAIIIPPLHLNSTIWILNLHTNYCIVTYSYGVSRFQFHKPHQMWVTNYGH